MIRLLQPPAIALMARQRLIQIRDSLRRKRVAVAPNPLKPIEARVLFLAEQALAVTNVLPSVPIRDFPGAFSSAPAETTSKFFVMGALGPTMPAFSSLFADGQDWLYQTLRKGTRDDRREKVDAGTTRFALAVWKRARELINAESDETARAAHLDRAKAFFLGHLCHVAGEVVIGPGLADAAWHLPASVVPTAGSPPAVLPGFTAGTDRARGRAVIDATVDDAVRRKVISPTMITGDRWTNWLPTGSEVPPMLFQAFAEVATTTYDASKAGWDDFETAFASLRSLPGVSKDWIAEGFSTMRAIMGTRHDWNYWTWAALLTPMAIPSLVTVPAFSALPSGKLITEDAHRGEERAWWEVLALQYGVSGCVIPLYVLIVNLSSYRGFSQEAWVALILAAVVLGFSIACFTMIGDTDASATTRWLMLGIPALLELLFAFVYILAIRGGGGRYNRVLAGVFVMHILMSLFPLAYLAIKTIGEDLRAGGGAAFGWWALWAAIAFGLGVAAPAGILFAMGAWGTSPDDTDAYLLERRYLRLFDDGVLVSDADVPVPTLAQLYYPTGHDGSLPSSRRRKLMTLWLAGGTLKGWVRVKGDRIEIKFLADEPAANIGPDFTVELPPSPVRLGDFATALGKIRETGGGAGVLTVRIDLPERERTLLGEGPILADGGQDNLADTQANRRAAILKWRAIGTSADDGFAVHHATKAALSVQVTGRGSVTAVNPSDDDDRTTTALAGQTATADAPGVGASAILGFGTRFLRDFAPGDIIQIGAAANQGVVLAIQDDTHLTTVLTITGVPALGGGAVAVARVNADRRYDQSGPGQAFTEAGTVTAAIAGVIPAATAVQLANATTRVLAAPANAAAIGAQIGFAIPGTPGATLAAAAAAVMARRPTGTVVTTPPRVFGVGTTFTRLFQQGDVIRVAWANTVAGVGGNVAISGTEERIVTRVVSDIELEIDATFSIAIDQVPAAGGGGTGAAYVRAGGHSRDGLAPVGTGAGDLFSGDTAMDHAADLAALLCLGGVSHVLTDAERQPTVGAVTRFPGPTSIAKVYQCFRNWNLDRRRVNEWKMLVAGGARSEKRGRPAAEPDPMMLAPDESWRPQSPGEDVANRVGWVPLLRRWLDVARRADADVTATGSLRPGDPSNLDLSRGLAFLLDLPDPGGV
jgi:hypothetical protein